MTKDPLFEAVVAELNIPSDVMFDETDVMRIVNNAIKSTKKVLEAERYALAGTAGDISPQTVTDYTFNTKNELGIIDI